MVVDDESTATVHVFSLLHTNSARSHSMRSSLRSGWRHSHVDI